MNVLAKFYKHIETHLNNQMNDKPTMVYKQIFESTVQHGYTNSVVSTSLLPLCNSHCSSGLAM